MAFHCSGNFVPGSRGCDVSYVASFSRRQRDKLQRRENDRYGGLDRLGSRADSFSRHRMALTANKVLPYKVWPLITDN